MITIMNNQPTTTTTNIQCGYVGDPPPPTPPPLQQTPPPPQPPSPQQQLKNSECHHNHNNNNNNNYDNSNSVRLTKTIENRFSTRCDNRNVVIIKNNNNNNNNNSLILTNIKNICDCRPHFHRKKRTVKDCVYNNNNNNNVNNNNNNNNKNSLATIITNIYLFILLLYTCLFQCKFLSSIVKITQNNNNNNIMILLLLLLSSSMLITDVDCYPNEFDKTEQLLDKLNLEKSIAAVFNKVAYGGSTTKRSIPDNIYPITTLSTPLLTTYRYSDGNDEWLRVDLKNNANNNNNNNNRNVNFDNKDEYDSDTNDEDSNEDHRIDNNNNNYGVDLEKDHVLPTSAPAADILKNNNNKNYNNPNRYNNDRLRPDYDNNNNNNNNNEQVTENIYKTTTTYNLLRNIRPTKSMYSKDIPSYVPPSRAFFTPPLPPEYQNPFADTPTLRGKNSDGFASRRPIPPPSLMPNKDRIPFRPDLPSNKVNVERQSSTTTTIRNTNNDNNGDRNEKKKTLNTPSNVRLNEYYGINRSNLHHNNSDSFEYEKSYAPEPSITRILSGSNGRHDDVKIPDILYHTVTATPNLKLPPKLTTTTTQQPPQIQPKLDTKIVDEIPITTTTTTRKNVADVVRKEPAIVAPPPQSVAKDVTTMTTTTTTEISVNLPNIREKTLNATQFTTEKIWLICWNVHIYLVVFVYIILAIYSIYKLICYENDPHMFSKSYFLTIHLMLTVICVLRIFYLIYDAYNINKSFNVFIYEFLHNFPLSLLATTFSVLILFLLKRTLIHLEVKNPIILVVFAIIYILLCFCLSIFETFNYFDKANLIICRPIYVLLVWSLGCSYLYLYRIIKNVLSKKSQNLSELCTQNILYASHITIAIALLFILLGVVQLYSLFFIKIDHFDANTLLIQQHWILWGYELSIRFIEITIIILLSLVVSLKLSQRNNKILNNEKHNNTATGFQLFPCTTTTNTTTSDSSTDNIYPNNCNTNPNAINYSRNEMLLDNLNDYDNTSGGGGGGGGKKSTLERFERPNWQITEQPQQQQQQRNSMTKRYQKPKYDLDYDDYQQQNDQPNITVNERNIYSEPIDNNHHQLLFERSDFDRRSRNSSTHTTTSSSSGRRSTTGRQSSGRKNLQYHPHHLQQQQQQRPTTHLSGIQTLPPTPHQLEPQRTIESMLVDEQGFVRFRHIQDDLIDPTTIQTTKHKKQHLKKMMQADINHYSDA